MESKKEILSELFDKYRNELKDLNEYLYNNPELGLQEYKACTAHTNILKKYGFEVEKGFANLETAYKASYKKGNGKCHFSKKINAKIRFTRRDLSYWNTC